MTPDERSAVYADLGGTKEIAEALGVTVFCVRRWLERRDEIGCPAPVRVLASGKVYSIAEWRGWHAVWRVTRGPRSWARKTTP